MKLLIKTNPNDWDDSLIVAQGVMKDGYVLSSAVTQIKARDLTEPWLAVWHGVVDKLKGDGDGSIVCLMATAELVSSEDDDEAVRLELFWQWPDGRSEPMQVLSLGDANAVRLVRFLLSNEAYLKSNRDDA